MSKKITYKRSIYTFLDLLGDVGGLLDGLRIFGGLFASFYTFIFGNPLTAFIVNAVYKVDKRTARIESSASDIERINRRTRLETLACQCLRGKKQKKLHERAIDRTDSVLEIDNFIKTQVQIKAALKAIFTKSERYLLRNNRNFVVNSISSSDSS